MEKTFLLWIILFWGANVFWGQTLAMRHYSIDEGMPGTYIKCIYQDSRGYIWFGTSNGVGRFDGLEFKNYHMEDGLTDDFILDITEDDTGKILVGTTSGGVNLLDGDKVKRFILKDELESWAVMAMLLDSKGALWFGTEKGVSRYDGHRFNAYTKKQGLVSNFIYSMLETKDGRIWLGTTEGLTCFQGGRFINYTTDNGLIHNNVQALLEDRSGRIWIGTENGINIIREGKFFSYTTADGLVGNNVLSVLEDRQGNIWIGTDSGISLFANGRFVNYTTQNGLLSNAVLSLLEDREGNIWIGTPAGASCLYSFMVVNYSVKNGLANNTVWAIMEDSRGRYWIGTEDGLSCLEKGKIRNYAKKDGLINSRIRGLMEDRSGKIWIATDGGLSIFAEDRFTNYTDKDGLLNNVVTTTFEDKEGIIWIGTIDGLNRFSDGVFTVPRFQRSQLKDYIKHIIEDQNGKLWLPTTTGLYRISSDRQRLFRYSAQNGLPHHHCYAVREDYRGRIWVGTKSGLICLEEGRLKAYSVDEGLPDNKCYFILEDGHRYLWIGTSKGIARFDGKTFKIYTQEDGFPTNNWNPNCWKDGRGNLWFGSVKGACCYDPALDRPNTTPPPVYITQISVLEKNVPLSAFSSLAYNQNYLKFEFVGLCFKAPQGVVYRYRLEGLDKEWRETGLRAVSYPYLPHGNYRFLVKAVNNNGVESPEPVKVRFKIRPPFWQTWWFRVILLLSVLIMWGSAVLWRIRREKERLAFEAKNRQLVMAQQMELLGILAAGAVHDLKNLLAVILGYSKLAEKSLNRDSGNRQGQDQPPMPLEKIKKTANTAIQVVGQILAFTRQRNGYATSVNLVNLLRDILDILNVTRPPEVKISWDPPKHEIKYSINPTRFQQLVMNLCLNAIQAMPGGGELKISLSGTHDSGILLEVSDTGCGIEKEAIMKIFDPLFTTKTEGKGTGLGLFVVKHIVEEYGGKIDIYSEPDRGTRFLISFPPMNQEKIRRDDH